MCGRYTLSQEEIDFDSQYGVIRIPNPAKRWNIAPTQTLPIIVLREGKAVMQPMVWGWRPTWSTHALINAQGETVTTKPTFKKTFQAAQRCLVPADGFYEWKTEPGGKQPMRFTLGTEASLFYFAGMWHTYPTESGPSEDCFLLLTTAANDLVAPIHKRMPVILHERAQYDAWISPENDRAEALTTHQQSGLQVYPVSKAVNNARHDAPDCARPL